MKRVLLCVFLSVSAWVTVLAQQQADQESTVENEKEPTGGTGQSVESQQPEESAEADASDKDFKPSEEISEDYPVPLPSDI